MKDKIVQIQTFTGGLKQGPSVFINNCIVAGNLPSDKQQPSATFEVNVSEILKALE